VWHTEQEQKCVSDCHGKNKRCSGDIGIQHAFTQNFSNTLPPSLSPPQPRRGLMAGVYASLYKKFTPSLPPPQPRRGPLRRALMAGVYASLYKKFIVLLCILQQDTVYTTLHTHLRIRRCMCKLLHCRLLPLRLNSTGNFDTHLMLRQLR